MIKELLKEVDNILLSAEEQKIHSSIGKDVKISADFNLNKIICDYITTNTTYPILSEEVEDSQDWSAIKGKYWIVDPLDGSLNFSREIPLYCVSLALFQGQQPLAGMIYDPIRRELFLGASEPCELADFTGCRLNGEAISVSSTETPGKGVITTGFPSYRDYSKESLNRFLVKVQRWKKVRLLGAAALSLAWVSAGRVDAYFEEDIRIWDVAAGVALVKAAGGTFHIEKGSGVNFVVCVATNNIIDTSKIIGDND